VPRLTHRFKPGKIPGILKEKISKKTVTACATAVNQPEGENEAPEYTAEDSAGEPAEWTCGGEENGGYFPGL